MTAAIKDKQGVPITFDNITDVNFKLTKIETPKDVAKIFDDSNVKEVYNALTETKETRALVSNYVNFTQ